MYIYLKILSVAILALVFRSPPPPLLLLLWPDNVLHLYIYPPPVLAPGAPAFTLGQMSAAEAQRRHSRTCTGGPYLCGL